MVTAVRREPRRGRRRRRSARSAAGCRPPGEPNVIASTTSATTTPSALGGRRARPGAPAARRRGWCPQAPTPRMARSGGLLQAPSGHLADAVSAMSSCTWTSAYRPLSLTERAALRGERVAGGRRRARRRRPRDEGLDLLAGVVRPAALGRDDHRPGPRRRRLREALLQRVQALLGLGAGDGEVVSCSLPPSETVSAPRSHREQEPERQHGLGVAGRPPCRPKPVEVGGQTFNTLTHSIQKCIGWWE